LDVTKRLGIEALEMQPRLRNFHECVEGNLTRAGTKPDSIRSVPGNLPYRSGDLSVPLAAAMRAAFPWP
jgi:hypothetical protein